MHLHVTITVAKVISFSGYDHMKLRHILCCTFVFSETSRHATAAAVLKIINSVFHDFP